MEKVIGIIGGMGPEATVDLFRKIVEATPAKRDQESVVSVIYSVKAGDKGQEVRARIRKVAERLA